jgi:hypothetical protein
MFCTVTGLDRTASLGQRHPNRNKDTKRTD